MTRRRMLAIVVAVALGAAPAEAARAGDTFSDGRFRLEWEVTTSRRHTSSSRKPPASLGTGSGNIRRRIATPSARV